jgi:hypothetical protein
LELSICVDNVDNSAVCVSKCFSNLDEAQPKIARIVDFSNDVEINYRSTWSHSEPLHPLPNKNGEYTPSIETQKAQALLEALTIVQQSLKSH